MQEILTIMKLEIVEKIEISVFGVIEMSKIWCTASGFSSMLYSIPTLARRQLMLKNTAASCIHHRRHQESAWLGPNGFHLPFNFPGC